MPRFEVLITDLPPTVGFDLPVDPKTTFGKVRAPVRVTINGHLFRTTVAAMGGRTFVGLNRAVQEAAGVSVGDRVAIDLELDDEPRTVDLPAEVAELLDPDARTFFDGLSYTHQKEYVRWIEEAKREETRRARIEKTVTMLAAHIRHP